MGAWRKKMETVINLIPSDYEGNPREALGYCWQDYSTKNPGIDVVVDISNGVDWKAEAISAMEEHGIKEAFINCMWGCSDLGGTITIECECVETVEVEILAGEDVVETSAISSYFKMIENASGRNKSHPGWCNKCQSYCYGDCQK